MHDGARARGTALLVNDTRAWYHFGCSCTSLALHAELRKRWTQVRSLPIHVLNAIVEVPRTFDDFDDAEFFARFAAAYPSVVAEIEQADIVVVNGEGTLHNVGPQALALLYVIYAAKTRLGKRVHLVNHSCFPDDTDRAGEGPAFDLYAKVYRTLDFVAVRETSSASLLGALGIAVTQSFDCLPLFVAANFARRSHAENRTVVIAGSVAWGGADVLPALGALVRGVARDGYAPRVLVGAAAHLAHDDVLFVEGLRREAGDAFGVRYATSELEWLDALSDARLVVSGRFHHSIAAAFVGTPFLVMESNTPKITAVVRMLENDAFVSVAEPDLAAALEGRSRRLLAEPGSGLVAGAVQDRLRELSLANFAGL
jgi:polysaccharide pyruvyl transferase WcaK-like protein